MSNVPVKESPAVRPLLKPGLAMLALLALAAVFFRAPALAGSRTGVELFRWALTGGLLAAYLAGYLRLRATAGGARAVATFGAGLCAAAVAVPPFHSTDLHCYINRGWQQVHYGQNPFASLVCDIPGWEADPMFRPKWASNPSPHGFAFAGASRLVVAAGGGDWLLTLYLFKCLNVGALLLTAWLTWLGLRRLGLPHPERALYLLLWNPLLLIHAVANGHNDVLMAALSCAGALAAVAGYWWAVVPALVAAGLVKYAAGFVVPLALVHLVKCHGWARAGVALAAGVAVGALIVEPYRVGGGPGFRVDKIAENATTMQNSLPALVCFPAELVIKRTPGWDATANALTFVGLVKLACWAGFCGFLARLVWKRLRGGPYPAAAFVRDALLTQFVLVCVFSTKFYPWYVGMFLPLAFWLPADDRLRRVVLAVACAQVFAVTFVGQSHGLNALALTVAPIAWALSRRPASEVSAEVTPAPARSAA